MRLYHGGVPDLVRGELILPGHRRKSHPGCTICAAREAEANGTGQRSAMDPLSEHPELVYLTPDKRYARLYASQWGRGDLYQVEPVGELTRSTEDTMPTWMAAAAKVLVAEERMVLMTWNQRRALFRQWGLADLAADKGPDH